jgi:hypothetical protein
MDGAGNTSLLVHINGLKSNAIVSSFSSIVLNWDQSFVTTWDSTITAKVYPQDGEIDFIRGDIYLHSVAPWVWGSSYTGQITGQLDIKFIPNTKEPDKVVDKKIDFTNLGTS